jgi:hypothetical protein
MGLRVGRAAAWRSRPVVQRRAGVLHLVRMSRTPFQVVCTLPSPTPLSSSECKTGSGVNPDVFPGSAGFEVNATFAKECQLFGMSVVLHHRIT